MILLINTPTVTDPYVENYIAEARKDYNIKSPSDLEALKRIIKQKLRDYKKEYDEYRYTGSSESSYSKELYETYRLLDTLIRGAREIKP